MIMFWCCTTGWLKGALKSSDLIRSCVMADTHKKESIVVSCPLLMIHWMSGMIAVNVTVMTTMNGWMDHASGMQMAIRFPLFQACCLIPPPVWSWVSVSISLSLSTCLYLSFCSFLSWFVPTTTCLLVGGCWILVFTCRLQYNSDDQILFFLYLYHSWAADKSNRQQSSQQTPTPCSLTFWTASYGYTDMIVPFTFPITFVTFPQSLTVIEPGWCATFFPPFF